MATSGSSPDTGQTKQRCIHAVLRRQVQWSKILNSDRRFTPNRTGVSEVTGVTGIRCLIIVAIIIRYSFELLHYLSESSEPWHEAYKHTYVAT